MTFGKLALILLLGAAIITGCEVGPDYKTPQHALPAGFDAGPGSPTTRPATQPADIQLWWTVVDDAELNSLIDRAAKANFDLLIAMARLNEARSFRYVIAADLYPTLAFSGAAARTTGNDATRGRMDPALNSATDTKKINEVTKAAGFDMSWEVDLFGHVARAVEAAEADTQALAEARNQVLVTVIADVVRFYSHLRGTQNRLKIAQDNVNLQERTLDLVKRRFALGLTQEVDVALAERQLESARATMPPLAAEVGVSQRQIAILLGVGAQTLYEELNRPAAAAVLPEAVALGVPADLLRHRPDIRQAERQLAAETARIGVAIADFFPEITLSGAAGYQAQGYHLSATDTKFIYSYGPGLRWPVLDFGRVEAAAELQDWRTKQALVTFRKTVESAAQEVDDSLGQFAGEQERLHRLRAAVDASIRAATLTTSRYERGLTDFLNVLDAQREQYVLEDQAAVSQESVMVYWAALNKALGRGWEAIGMKPQSNFKPPPIGPALELINYQPDAAPEKANEKAHDK